MIVSTVVIYQCDNCPKKICLQTAEQWLAFELIWHEGLRYQFCPDCQNLPEVQIKIARDDAFIRSEAKTITEVKNVSGS